MKRLMLGLVFVVLVCGCDTSTHTPPPAPHNGSVQATQPTPQTVARKKLPRFADLDKETQAVVVGLEYHLGPKNGARFIAHIAAGNYEAAIALLEAEKGIFANRRKAEAKLLRKALGKR